MLAILIIVILLAGLGIGLWVRHSLARSEQKKYYDAAARMIRENCLDEVILSRGKKHAAGDKIMIYIKTAGKQKQGFVFDPQKGIRIGRSPEGNEICIRDSLVSASHCCIYLYQGQPVVQDFNSSNGTWIKRGFGSHRVNGTERILSGDRLIIGESQFKLLFFTFDMMRL